MFHVTNATIGQVPEIMTAADIMLLLILFLFTSVKVGYHVGPYHFVRRSPEWLRTDKLVHAHKSYLILLSNFTTKKQ